MIPAGFHACLDIELGWTVVHVPEAGDNPRAVLIVAPDVKEPLIIAEVVARLLRDNWPKATVS